MILLGSGLYCEGRQTASVGALAIAVCGIGTIVWGRGWSAGIDIYEPIIFNSIWFIIIYAIPILLWSFDKYLIHENRMISDDFVNAMSRAMWALALFMLCTWIGYALVVKRKSLRICLPDLCSTTRMTNVRVLYLTGVLFRGMLLSLGLRGNVSVFLSYQMGNRILAYEQLLSVVEMCFRTCGIILLLFYFAQGSSGSRAWLYAVLAGESLLAVWSGSRGAVGFFFLQVICCSYYARGRFPPIRALILAIPVVLFSTSIVQLFRVSDQVSPDASAIGLLHGLSAVSHFVWPDLADAYKSFADALWGRQVVTLQLMASMFRLHPAPLPFEGLGDVLSIPVNLIPRLLWPGKPVLSEAMGLSRVYMGSDSFITFSSSNVVGHLYRMGGWPVVFGGSVLWGATLGLLYKGALAPGKVTNLVLFLALQAEICGLGFTIPSAVLLLVRYIPIVLIFMYLFVSRHDASDTYSSGRFTVRMFGH
jgi:hypothetical protein